MGNPVEEIIWSTILYLRGVYLGCPLDGGQLPDDVEHAVEGRLLETSLLEAVHDGAQQKLLVARARTDTQDLEEDQWVDV